MSKKELARNIFEQGTLLLDYPIDMNEDFETVSNGGKEFLIALNGSYYLADTNWLNEAFWFVGVNVAIEKENGGFIYDAIVKYEKLVDK
jgi:hypothetical protein